jgi:hypothetical protein
MRRSMPMPDFRVYFIGLDGHITHVEPLPNVTEAEALEKAKQWLDGDDRECEGSRQVAVLNEKSNS